jgi:hypothetical protein
MPRLVSCHFCQILQRLPDVPKNTPLIPAVLEYANGERLVLPDEDGLPRMVPAYDPILEDFVSKHEHGMPDEMVTHKQMIEIWAVDQNTWDSMDIVTKIKSEIAQQTGKHYEESDEYKEAATKCYNAHGNPDLSSGCPDYLDDSKRLGTAAYHVDGQTIEIPPKYRQYLCYLCPFQQAYVEVEIRRKQGMYKEGPTPRQERNLKRRHKRG